MRGALRRSFLLLHLFSTSATPPPQTTVAAYLPEWRYEGANWVDISKTVTQLILFSLEVQPSGRLSAHDRLPRKELMLEARAATRAAGTKLLLCIGGNGRSAGFAHAVSKNASRTLFVDSLLALLDKHDLDGVDLNWEYPGYSFGSGYHADDAIQRDYKGLSLLVKKMAKAFRPSGRIITLAYYPDGKQEKLLLDHNLHKHVANMHMMSYDQPGKHSTLDWSREVASRGAGILPPELLTLGVPFYGRHIKTGDWKSYEDLVQMNAALLKNRPEVDEAGGYYFNGPGTIAKKVQLARSLGLGGVMIWEVGQDCRRNAVVHGETTHAVTCPQGEESSLLASLKEAREEADFQSAYREAVGGGGGGWRDEL